MQHYKHTTTGEVYGADASTIPPAAFFEHRVGDHGRPEFSKVAKPAKGKGGDKPADASGDADTSGDGGGQ